MENNNMLVQVFIYLASALVAVLLGRRLGMGAVLGYLLVGAIIGPWGIGLMGRGNSEDGVMHMAEFGVVMMLFLVGLELQPETLWQMRRQIVGLGTLQVTLCALFIGVAAYAAGMDWHPALATGLILTVSSTAIVLQSLREKGLSRTEAGQNAFAILLFQDLAVIPIMAVIPLLALSSGKKPGDASHESWMSHFPGWLQALITIGAVVLVVVLARLVLRPLFRAIAKTRQREAFTAAALLLVVGVALLMHQVGLSAALGTFIAGVVLATSEYKHELESDLEPFKGLLLGVFFLGVGIGIDFGHIRDHAFLVAGLTAGLLVVKGLVIYLLARVNGSPRDSSVLLAASIAGGSEFAFVLITLAVNASVLTNDISRTLVAVVALSMAATPPLITLSQRLPRRRKNKIDSTRDPDVVDEGSPVIICGFGRFGHAVGRLVRAQGFACTVLDRDEDQVELLRSIGIPVFYGDASRPDMLVTAGASHAKILVIALRDSDTSLKIAELAAKHFPHLKIFLRAHSRLEAYRYVEKGHERIYRDTLDSSLTMGIDVLRTLGFPAYAAHRAARLYRKGDEAAVRKMAVVHRDSTALNSVAREAIRALDEVLRADRYGAKTDEGWVRPKKNP